MADQATEEAPETAAPKKKRAAPGSPEAARNKALRLAAPTRSTQRGTGRSYTLDGEWCKGVTSIISDGIPKNGLIGWASNTVSDFVMNRLTIARNEKGEARIVADELVADLRAWNLTRGRNQLRISDADILPRADLGDILSNVRYRDLDQAGKRGTEVHGLGERLARGEEVVPPEELVGHVDAYVRFLNEWQPTNALLEFVVVNRRWRYMGRGDMIADFPGIWPEGTPWAGEPLGRGLIDIKTARSGIFAEVALQLQAYRFAEVYLGTERNEAGTDFLEIPMPKVDFIAAVHVRADGYDVIGFKVTDDPDTDPAFRAFLFAKQVGDFLDWKKGPASTIKTEALPIPERTTT